MIFVLEAVMMATVLWATLGHSQESTREQFESSERAILEVMAGISHIALQTGKYDELQPYFLNLLEDSRITQVMLVDARGIVVAASDEDAIGKFPSVFSAAGSVDESTNASLVWRSKEVRSGGRRLGVLAIEISDAPLLEITSEARNLGIGIAVIGMIIIAVIGLAAGIILTRRLGRVTDAAHRFASGEADARAKIGGRDEIGDLGHTFDRMADSLQANAAESRQLIDQLSQKNAELERFAYTVSHDLKSPLVTIRNYLGMLEKDIREDHRDRIERDFEFIASATDTMAELLEDLLELSRIGHIVNEFEAVGLSDVFEQVLKILDVQISNSGARVTLQPQMPMIYVDRIRMAEVAQNLIENALKFSRDIEHPKISISAYEEAGQIICCVEDNGVGIEPQFQEQIFGLFNRLDQSVEGTGIGLTLVKRIIEVHGGRVWVESPGLGHGTRFSFALPKVQQEAA